MNNPDNGEVVVSEQNSFGSYVLKTPLRFQSCRDRFAMAV